MESWASQPNLTSQRYLFFYVEYKFDQSFPSTGYCTRVKIDSINAHCVDDFDMYWRYFGEFSAGKIRTELNSIYPGVHKLVLELRGNDDSWAGFGPNKPDKNMFKWLKENWQ